MGVYKMPNNEKMNQSIKVCHICSNFDNFFINFMNQFVSEEVNIKVFYPRAIERGLPDIKAPYLDVRLNYNQLDRIFFLKKENKIYQDYIKLYGDSGFNLIHAHTLFSNGYIALKLKENFNIPYIVAVRDMDVNLFLKYRLNLRKIGVEILKEATKIVFISDNYKNQVVNNYIPKNLKSSISSKSVVVPNGIDNFYLNNIYLRDKNTVHEKQTINIITVGYISKRKNQLDVCKAVEQLNVEGLSIKYTIIGKVLDDKIFKKIMRYDFVDYKSFLSKEDLINEYRKADIFVMPSITETFGITYAEAMSQGLPVIYTKNQGFDGQFEEGEIGFHVGKGNIEDIKKSIFKIINKYDMLSENCTLNSKKFDWEIITKNYINMYKNII